MFKPFRFAVLLAGVTLAVSAWAQPAPDEDGPDQGGPAADPPTRVARLAYLDGDVSFVPAGENDWVEAQLNRPLITGDKLWSDRGSHAALNLGESSLRIDQNTSFDFLNLDDKVAQVELTQGSINLHVRRLYDDQTYEIDTPTLAFVINRVGEFRVDVLPDGQATVVTVLQGAGDAYGEGGARFRIEEGQSVTFNDPQLQDYQSGAVPRPDDFDRFVEQRDHRWENSSSRRYVSEDVIGYEDLDDNGEWSDSPEYGSVWYPTTVAVGWTPYHYGHWGWVGAYGWTWIDDAPWGFAPFHYGRWAYVGNRWGWCPGPVAVRAVYAPALVAFVGGGGVAVGFGTGPVGWFPLGPRDVYFPSYRVSERYFVSINIGGSRGLDRVAVGGFYGGYHSGHIDYERVHYGNREVAGAVVAVPHEAFVNAHPVGRAAIAVNHETFVGGGRVSSFAAVAPTRTSLVATGAVARHAPPAAVANRPIVAASKPPAPVAPFAQRQAALSKNPGQPLSAAQLHTAPIGANNAAAAAVRQNNVKVVTNTGAPVRTAAPALPARASVGANATTGHGAPNGGAAPVNHQLPAVQNQQNNAAVNNNGRGPGNTPTTGRQLPAVQGQQNQTTAAGAGNSGRPSASQHLDSSRFAHPQTGAATTGGGVNAGTTGQPARTLNNDVQHSNAGAAAGTGTPNRYTNEHAPLNNNAATNAAATHTPAATPSTPRSSTGASSSTGSGNPYSRDSGYNRGAATSNNNLPQNRPEVHSSGQQQSHVDSAHVQQPSQQQYHQVQQPQAQQQQPQYHQVQPQQQPQQQTHAPTSSAPQTQMGQGFQQHQPPPQQPQHVQPQATQSRPQPSSKEKKDDDKRH